MDIFGLSDPDSIRPQLRNTNKFIKLSWCVHFQFQIENLFQNLLGRLGEKPRRGYWNVSRKIVDTLSLPYSDRSHRKLNILALVRNSLHNNGTHLQQDFQIQVDRVKFRFKKGNIVRCAYWDHIAHVWLHVLPILKNIYYHPRVRSISGTLPANFV
jgi:hypothetical protein